MSTVAQGFGQLQLQRKVPPKRPANPYDKATVISALPKEIKAIKHTISPGYFYIPPAGKDDFNLLVVGPSSWYREIDESQPYLEVPEPATEVARSICQDYCNGLLGCNMADKMPALFYVPGSYDKKSILVAKIKLPDDTEVSFLELLTSYRIKQRAWYQELVMIADTLWARTNGNPLAISDDARYGAELLGLKDKPWLKDFKAAKLDNCPACGALVNFEFPVCSNCKMIINQEKAKELNIQFASK